MHADRRRVRHRINGIESYVVGYRVIDRNGERVEQVVVSQCLPGSSYYFYDKDNLEIIYD